MVLQPLIGLSKSMVIYVTSLGVSVATEVRFLSTGFLNFNIYSFYLKMSQIVTYLIILHPHFNWELVGHNECVCFN